MKIEIELTDLEFALLVDQINNLRYTYESIKEQIDKPIYEIKEEVNKDEYIVEMTKDFYIDSLKSLYRKLNSLAIKNAVDHVAVHGINARNILNKIEFNVKQNGIITNENYKNIVQVVQK